MEKQVHHAVAHSTATFFSSILHPLKLKIFLLKKLPAAFFSGLKVTDATNEICSVSVPYRWFTQNPFHSTYFACLSMAAELSTGVLAMANISGRKPHVSMLITGMEAAFHKKATGLTIFTCSDGFIISDTVAKAIDTRQAQEVKVHSVGRNLSGDVVAEFWFTWSFKTK